MMITSNKPSRLGFVYLVLDDDDGQNNPAIFQCKTAKEFPRKTPNRCRKKESFDQTITERSASLSTFTFITDEAIYLPQNEEDQK